MATTLIPETPAQRKARLMSKAALCRLRVKRLATGGYRVPSGTKGPDGRPVADYTVCPVRTGHGPGWACGCAWGQQHGAYVPGVTDVALCKHIAQICKHEERAAREQERAARHLIAAAERIMRAAPETVADRRALANAAWDDLFGGAVAAHNVPEGSR